MTTLADDWGDAPARVTSHDLDAFERVVIAAEADLRRACGGER